MNNNIASIQATVDGIDSKISLEVKDSLLKSNIEINTNLIKISSYQFYCNSGMAEFENLTIGQWISVPRGGFLFDNSTISKGYAYVKDSSDNTLRINYLTYN